MKALKFFPQHKNDHLIQPEEFYDLHPESPAMNVLSDFRQHKPHMIDSHLKASEALNMMLVEDVSMKIVVDIEKEFIGVLDRNHLTSENMLLKQLTLGLKHSELQVKDLMFPRSEMLAVDIDQLHQVKVGDLVSSMKTSHQQYLLVVDKDAHHIRGIVSASDIARRLHQPVAIEKERTFVDIFTAVHVS
jgi:Mg2+/Co2+ transporter CorC